MFQHFILTRFNLRKKGWDETKSQSKVLTDSWMENRLKLFEQYCYSSIKSQTVKNFEWLVFFDTNTPEIYREKINELASKFSNFIPIYTDGMENFYPLRRGLITMIAFTKTSLKKYRINFQSNLLWQLTLLTDIRCR